MHGGDLDGQIDGQIDGRIDGQIRGKKWSTLLEHFPLINQKPPAQNQNGPRPVGQLSLLPGGGNSDACVPSTLI